MCTTQDVGGSEDWGAWQRRTQAAARLAAADQPPELYFLRESRRRCDAAKPFAGVGLNPMLHHAHHMERRHGTHGTVAAERLSLEQQEGAWLIEDGQPSSAAASGGSAHDDDDVVPASVDASSDY
eukprot:COSAG01_NODE_36402_length_518_cov_1.097852_1_plen_124_part_10